MKKTTKKILIGVAILISIIFIAMLSQGKFPFALYGQGMTIKSMSSNVNVISQDTDLSGVWWLINAYTGGGQSISGTLTPEDTKQLTGYQTKYPLNIKVSALNEKINYEIQNTGTQVYTYTDTTLKSECSCTDSCWTHPDAPTCPTGTDYELPIKIPANWGTYVCERHCFKKTQVGVLGTIAPSNVKGDVQVDLTVNNELISKNIEVGSSADFISSKGLSATVQYPANGWTGNYPKDTSNFYAMYDIFNGKNQWTLTSKQRYTNYISQKSLFEDYLQSFSVISFNTYEDALADINNKFGRLNTEVIGMRQDDLSISQNQVWGNRIDSNNGKITLDTSGQLTIADLVFKVRADWLGIVINVGKPSITGKTCTTFKAGDTSKITLQVKNIGGADGNFVPSVTCPNIKQTYNLFSVPISLGETKSIEIPIDAGNFAPSSTTSDTCQIKVEEYNKPSNYVTSSVSCTIEPPAFCVEGTIDTSGNCIRKCVNGKSTQLKCCNTGETVLLNSSNIGDSFGGYYCYDGGCTDDKVMCNGECKDSCDNKCSNCDAYVKSQTLGLLFQSQKCESKEFLSIKTQNNWTCIFSWLKLLAVPLAFILTLLFGINTANRYKKKNMRYTIFGSTILISLIVGYLVYTLFVVGLIVLALFSLASFLIKSFVPFR
jgi:hypothetical protein